VRWGAQTAVLLRPGRWRRASAAIVLAVPAVVALAPAYVAAESRVFLADRLRGGPAFAEIGREQRAVLFRSGSVTLAVRSEPATVPASGEVTVPVVLPSTHPPDRPVRAIVVVGDRARVTEVVVTGENPSAAVHLRFAPEDVGHPLRYVLYVDDAPPPGARVVRVGPVPVTRNARLELALGIDPRRCSGHPVIDVGVDAVVGRRGTPLLRRRLDPGALCGLTGERIDLYQRVAHPDRPPRETVVVPPRSLDTEARRVSCAPKTPFTWIVPTVGPERDAVSAAAREFRHVTEVRGPFTLIRVLDRDGGGCPHMRASG
jgi:hypothetical protein